MAKEKFKPDLSKLSINQLQELTGCSYRTVKKRLSDEGVDPIQKDGNSLFYDPKEALPIIFEVQGYHTSGFAPDVVGEDPGDSESTGRMDPAKENAKLAKARTEKIKIEIEVMKKNLIPADEVEREWSDLVVAFRSRILGISARYASILFATIDVREFEIKLKDIHRDALTQLSKYTPGEEVEPNEDDPTTSE